MFTESSYDAVIVGGGPGGLSAALALGRARKSVLVCDAGPRRNAAATHINNFLTRDGTPPEEFRVIAHDQLEKYPNVVVRNVGVDAIGGKRNDFAVSMGDGRVRARRVLLCTGMKDEILPIEGFLRFWGHSIFQCPYCHGWELQDRAWGILVSENNAAHLAAFSLMALGWTHDVTIFTNGVFELAQDVVERLVAAGIGIETNPIACLRGADSNLATVVLEGGRGVSCEALFAHPPQSQTALVCALETQLDEHGYVRVDPMTQETSVAGIYAAGDLTTRMQKALLAAAAGTAAAAMINMDLALDIQPVAIAGQSGT